MNQKVVINLLSTALSTLLVIVPMILFDAPTWAWFGIGSLMWMLTVNLEAMKGRKK